jgi:AsmA protein
MLKLADVYFELGTGSIRYRKISVGESALNFDLKGGRLTATMTKLTLYGGGGTGRVTIDGTGAAPAIEESFSLKGVDLGPLLSDFDNITVLTGAASVDLAVRGSGNSPRDITASLAGKGNLHLGKGALKGIDLIDKAQHAASVLSLGLAGTRTDFDSLDATFTVANGVLKNDDLKLTAADLPVTGAGTVDLPRRQVDYRLTPKLGGVLTVPVAISGPWDNLRYDTETIDIITAPVRALGSAIINLFSPDSDTSTDPGSSKPQ